MTTNASLQRWGGAEWERSHALWWWNLPLLGCIFSLGVNLIPFPLCTSTYAAQGNKKKTATRVKCGETAFRKRCINIDVIAPSKSSFGGNIAYLVHVDWSQMSWWVCPWSECRGTGCDEVRTARHSSLGRPSSDHSLLRGSIAAKKNTKKKRRAKLISHVAVW